MNWFHLHVDWYSMKLWLEILLWWLIISTFWEITFTGTKKSRTPREVVWQALEARILMWKQGHSTVVVFFCVIILFIIHKFW